MGPEELTKQFQADHDTIIRVEGKVDNLIEIVKQNNLATSTTVQTNTKDITELRFDVDRLKTGMALTRWFFGVISGLIALVATVYATFFRH